MSVPAAPQGSDSEDSNERPDWACQLHQEPSEGHFWKQADEGWRTCEACLVKVRDVIKDIRRLYSKLDVTPGAMQETGSRGAPGFGSKPGASLHVVSMRDKRSVSYEVGVDTVAYENWRYDPDGWVIKELPLGVQGPEARGVYTTKREGWKARDGKVHSEQARPPRSVPKVLESLAQMIAEAWGREFPTGTVDQLCHWLDVSMDYVTKQGWCADVDEELRQLRAQLRPVSGEGRKNKILECPNIVDEDDHTRVCGANLYEPNRNGVIKCHACKREWSRDKWEGHGPDYLRPPGHLSLLATDTRQQRIA